MKLLTKPGITTGLLVLAQACVVDTRVAPDSDASESSVERTDAALNGVWRTHCDADPEGSRRREVSFCDEAVYFLEFRYSDEHCSTLRTSASYEATVDERSELRQGGARALRQTLLAVVATPLDVDSASRLEAQQTCPGVGWTPGRSIELMGCNDGRDEPRLDSLYRIDDRSLSLTSGSAHPAARDVVDAASLPSNLAAGTATTYFRVTSPDGFCGGHAQLSQASASE